MSKPDDRRSSDRVLREAQDRFIAAWGQMGSSWGIPRTMAEVHALLFIVGEPMNSDEVMERLLISRGNASMTLRALMDWGIVARVHRPGDRKEYFEAEQDVWKLFRTVLRERKKREIDPLLQALFACRDMVQPPGGAPGGASSSAGRRALGPEAAGVRAHQQRLDNMLEFMKIVDAISERFISPASGRGLEKAAKLLARAS